MNELKERNETTQSVTDLTPRKKGSRKDRIKNIAIVFLAVLLVFTFFSNTIMNRSLPEVSGQYAGSGTISTSIRGTGTVTANMAYSVQIDSTRQIRAVYMKSGDTVEAGQVLFALEDADSQELKDARQALRAAQQELQTMQYNYSVKLLENLPADYTSSNQEIANLQADLAAAIADQAAVAGSGVRLDGAKLSVRSAEDRVAQIGDQITAIDDEITRLNGEIAAIQAGEINDYPALVTAADNLRLVQTAQALAQTAYDNAAQTVADLEAGVVPGASSSSMTVEQRTLEDLEAHLAQLREDYQQLLRDKQLYDNALSAVERAQANAESSGSSSSGYSRAKAVYDAAVAALEDATAVTYSQVSAAELNVANLEITLQNAQSQADLAKTTWQTALQAAQEASSEPSHEEPSSSTINSYEAIIASLRALYQLISGSGDSSLEETRQIILDFLGSDEINPQSAADVAYSAYLNCQATAQMAENDLLYARQDLETINNDYETYQRLQNDVTVARANLALYQADESQASAELQDAQAALAALTPVTDNHVLQAQREIEQQEITIQRQQEDLAALQQENLAATVQNLNIQDARDQQAAAKESLDNAKEAVANAQTAYDNAVNRQVRALQSQVSSQQSLRTSANQSLRTAQRALEDAQEAYADLQTDAAQEESLADTITSLQRSLSTAVAAQASQQQQDSVSGQITDLELEQDQLRMEQQQTVIQEQEAVVAELEAANTDTAVTARYAGTITTVAVVAGDTAAPGQELAAIDVEGKGYTLTISVTSEQSRQVHVGDHAAVSNYWWGDLDVELTAIKPDPANPGQSRLLEFTVSGDVSEGQSLELSIGERQTRYDLVVPNSAIREDSNGTFILVATSKSTPLATRYTATRVNVTVIAKDSYNTAIDAGSDYGYEYVITTSTKPLEAGSQIRLVNG